MKLSEELKIKRAEKVAEMQAVLEARKENGILRAATAEETTKYDGLKAEVARMDTDIADAEALEVRGIEQPQKREFNIGGKAAPYSVGKAIREFARGEDKLTGIEAEQHKELGRGIQSGGLLVPFSRSASPNTLTTHATSIDVVIDPNLSIIGYEPLWGQMGLTVLNGLQGTVKLGKKTHDVAGKYAETAEIVAESNVPSYVTLAPDNRYGITDLFTKELLAQENPAVQAAIVADMIKGCDRKLTAEVYTIALAAATEVAAGALTVAGFNALMGAVDLDGAFAMDRASFFAAKGVAIGTAASVFLAQMGAVNGVGNSYDGAKIFYSNLFADGAAKQYAVYGAWSEIYLGFWGALEIMINPYTYQKVGQIELTVNRLADVKCRNTAAFVKTPDLDSAT